MTLMAGGRGSLIKGNKIKDYRIKVGTVYSQR